MSSKRASAGSLATRLTLATAGASLLLVGAAMAWTYAALARSLAREDDDEISDQIRILQRLDTPEAVRQEVEVEALARRRSRLYLRVMDAQGRILAETPGIPALEFPEPAVEPQRSVTREQFRLMSVHSNGKIYHVALDRAEEEELLKRFRWAVAPILFAVLVGASGLGLLIARRGVRPIREIVETAKRIRSTTLGERIDPTRLPEELGSLAQTFNGMLDRLQESFERLGRFSADIAHELRTPLNNLRGEIEVSLGKGRTSEEYREVLDSCLEECVRLSRIIESLLFLARAEQAEMPLRRERVSLSKELEAIREFYEAGAAEKGVALASSADGLEADLDRTLFQRAVGNLIENALAHTPAGGRIEIAATRDAAGIAVRVTDTGVGIPAAHLPHVFDRFYRVDPARSGGASGLGLAIVKSIVDLHGGTARIESEPGRGTWVTLHLPQMTKT